MNAYILLRTLLLASRRRVHKLGLGFLLLLLRLCLLLASSRVCTNFCRFSSELGLFCQPLCLVLRYMPIYKSDRTTPHYIYSTHLRSWNSAQRRQLAVRASTGPIPRLGSRSAWTSVFGPGDEMAGAVRTDIDAPEASTRILRRRSHLQNRHSWEMSRSHGFSRESRCGDVTRRRGKTRLVACMSQTSICSPALSSVRSWMKESQFV